MSVIPVLGWIGLGWLVISNSNLKFASFEWVVVAGCIMISLGHVACYFTSCLIERCWDLIHVCEVVEGKATIKTFERHMETKSTLFRIAKMTSSTV